jgi:hypothetical protein
MGYGRPNRCKRISLQILCCLICPRTNYTTAWSVLILTKIFVWYQMFWFDIAPVGSSSIQNHRKSNQLDDFIPFGLFDAKGFGMTFDSCVHSLNPHCSS